MNLINCSVLSIFLAITFLVFVESKSEDDLLVTVKQGQLKGHRLTTGKGKDILAFQGIPYAKPPLGALRFELSRPGDSWEGVLDATVEGPECTQLDTLFDAGKLKGVEDCLYINVYTPQIKTSEPLAVLVWIHGGGWFSGSSSSIVYGPNYLLDKDIVLVTFNYRLGALGFLSTGDSVCPGNNGLKDQTLALKWVRDNIVQFGGNPDKVTIAGQSAGGGSTQYHMISPMSKGLFHGAISQSGSVLGPWAIAPKHEGEAQAKKLGTLLKCPTDISAELIKCLRTKDVDEIIETDPHFKEWGWDPIITFRPVVEGEGDNVFIPDEPIELLKKASAIADVPWMVGLTSGEGALNVATIINNEKMLQEINTDFHRLAPLSMLYRDTSPAPHYVTEKIREFYFGSSPITAESSKQLVDMYTDSFFFHPIDSSVRIISKYNTKPVFFYYFDYKAPTSYSTLFGDKKRDYGVAHCDELQFLFPHEKLFPDKKLSKEDHKMIDILTTLWSDFVKKGNPTPKGSSLPHWDRVKRPEVEYLHIGPKAEIDMGVDLLSRRSNFWSRLPLTQQPHSIRDEL